MVVARSSLVDEESTSRVSIFKIEDRLEQIQAFPNLKLSKQHGNWERRVKLTRYAVCRKGASTIEYVLRTSIQEGDFAVGLDCARAQLSTSLLLRPPR